MFCLTVKNKNSTTVSGMDMNDETGKELDKLKLKVEVNRAINKMLDCMFSRDDKKCNQCKDVDACSFLTGAVFGCRERKLIFLSTFH